MNSYVVRIVRGTEGATKFSLATYAAVAISAADARLKAIDSEREGYTDDGPIRSAFVQETAVSYATHIKRETVSADQIAELENRPDAYVTRVSAADYAAR